MKPGQLFIWFFSVITAAVFAGPETESGGNAAIRGWVKLRERYLGLKSLSGSFTERLVAEMTGETTFFAGSFYFQMPNRFRLEVTKPMRQVIVGNESIVWFYLPEEKRAVMQRRQEPFPLLAFIAPLLDTTGKITEQRLPDGTILLLIQDEAGAVFRDMKLELDKSGSRVDAFSFVDDWGNRCRFVLQNQRWNPVLGQKLFRFVPPPGTTVEYQ
ncbi:MAG: outer membrane lipoprotein carrier protein LolA [candidate division WOR-3 bacterium]|jgi:chaperone LolA|nr:outer membrane lipoprotein carrier protein LolA [candidate division WOR-3 bacterium]MCR4423714.1 outer membrane lipoprotein carrier protein LolA [candidate division WOR-3 bacterium]MDH7519053.1 outer membrane lipoprotein carrier protein LolA [bacterium]